MRIWPRRKPTSPPHPVVLPSLDRLAGLIERVVELVDEVSGAPVAAPPGEPLPPPASTVAPAPQPPLPVPLPAISQQTEGGSWLAFVPSAHGYTLIVQPGLLPPPGNELDLDGARYRVLRHAPSPLPGDGRRCAVVEMEEQPEADRSSAE
jgi:hypothetical protein